VNNQPLIRAQSKRLVRHNNFPIKMFRKCRHPITSLSSD
jgi:hypothetical protein